MELIHVFFGQHVRYLTLSWLLCEARDVSPEDAITFLESRSERNSLTKNVIGALSISHCKELLLLHRDAKFVRDDLFSRIGHLYPREGAKTSRDHDTATLVPLSDDESDRIMTAIYRWEPWAVLFIRPELEQMLLEDMPPYRMLIPPESAAYLSHYTRWALDQLETLKKYAFEKYTSLGDEADGWLLDQKDEAELKKYYEQEEGFEVEYLLFSAGESLLLHPLYEIVLSSMWLELRRGFQVLQLRCFGRPRSSIPRFSTPQQ